MADELCPFLHAGDDVEPMDEIEDGEGGLSEFSTNDLFLFLPSVKSMASVISVSFCCFIGTLLSFLVDIFCQKSTYILLRAQPKRCGFKDGVMTSGKRLAMNVSDWSNGVT